MSKTQEAMAYLKANPEESAYSIAQKFGLSPTTIYTTIKRAKAKESLVACPCCGTVLPEEKINRKVLK